jgi:hypothetical protein
MGLSLLSPRRISLHCRDGRQDRGECLPGFLAGHVELSRLIKAQQCMKNVSASDGGNGVRRGGEQLKVGWGVRDEITVLR